MRITKKVRITLATMLVTVGALMALSVFGTTTQALTSTYRDCMDDAIIRCGALSQSELLSDYDKNDGDVQAIYAHFGIKRTDIAGTTSQVKMGLLKPSGAIVVDGKTVATDASTTGRLRHNSSSVPFTVNGKTYYSIKAYGYFQKDADVYVLFKNGQFFRAIQTSCGNVVTATPPKPQPVYSCDSLKATKIDRTRYKFVAAATAKNGVSVANYTFDFGDGKKYTGASTIEHTYAKPGAYTVTVHANIKGDGEWKAVTGPNCKVTVKVDAVPVKPLYECKSLTARIVKAETRTYEYTLSYTAENGAMLKKVVYDFGDSKVETYEATKAAKVQHSYAKAGSYHTTATLYFSVKSGETTVEKTVKCEVSTDSKPEVCDMPGKEHLPKDSPECKETPENPTPPELPQTGLGGLISASLGLGSISAASYYFVASRRNLLSALLNR